MELVLLRGRAIRTVSGLSHFGTLYQSVADDTDELVDAAFERLEAAWTSGDVRTAVPIEVPQASPTAESDENRCRDCCLSTWASPPRQRGHEPDGQEATSENDQGSQEPLFVHAEEFPVSNQSTFGRGLPLDR